MNADVEEATELMPQHSQDLPFGMRMVGEPPGAAPHEIIGVVVARNEALRIGAAIRHARRLGVGPIILIDNLSTDGTRANATGFDRVHVIEAPEKFSESHFGINWLNAILDRFAHDRWVLIFDADELLVYPGSEAPGSLPMLCDHLDGLKAECLLVRMLDCFPKEPLHAVRYQPGEPLTEAAPWFEPPRLHREAAPHFPYVAEYGGIRERLFFPETNPRNPGRFIHQKLFNLGWRLPLLRQHEWFAKLAPRCSPNLTKVPLLRWRAGMRWLNNHSLTPLALAESQPSGVLLHYKFLQDFHDRVVDAVTRGAHFDGSAEYHRYLVALKQNPQFTLHSERSLRYTGSDQLVGLGLMQDTAEWDAARSRVEAMALSRS